jgi:hypothetical protein
LKDISFAFFIVSFEKYFSKETIKKAKEISFNPTLV